MAVIIGFGLTVGYWAPLLIVWHPRDWYLTVTFAVIAAMGLALAAAVEKSRRPVRTRCTRAKPMSATTRWRIQLITISATGGAVLTLTALGAHWAWAVACVGAILGVGGGTVACLVLEFLGLTPSPPEPRRSTDRLHTNRLRITPWHTHQIVVTAALMGFGGLLVLPPLANQWAFACLGAILGAAGGAAACLVLELLGFAPSRSEPRRSINR